MKVSIRIDADKAINATKLVGELASKGCPCSFANDMGSLEIPVDKDGAVLAKLADAIRVVEDHDAAPTKVQLLERDPLAALALVLADETGSAILGTTPKDPELVLAAREILARVLRRAGARA